MSKAEVEITPESGELGILKPLDSPDPKLEELDWLDTMLLVYCVIGWKENNSLKRDYGKGGMIYELQESNSTI